eukprot:TRINITY_DN3246_c0_g1_i3.p1 TRINITY_DN3246_c0_g1~~TRINITY_DN3246_c0_g1_i3.p1  ORF type:complete len:367 (-),score=83.72 TRINITY_DN3246_c0_g1_i3:584-1684(-)
MEPGEGQPLLQVPIERRASGTSLRIEARAHGVDAPYEPSELSPKQAEFLSHIRISRGVKYFDRQVLNYDSRRLSSLGVVDGAFQAASTFRSGYLWRDSLGLVLYSVAIGSAVALTHRAEDGKCDPEQARSIDEAIRALYPFTGNVLALLPFLLGLYLSTALSRWWSMRTECIGGLWDAMSDMCVLVSSLYPLREHAYIRHRVVRWSLLSHLLIYKEATGDEDLSSLVQEQLLLPDELVRLRSKPIKGQLVWTWMNAFFAHLALDPVAHPLPMREQHLPRIVKLCAKARSSIGGVFSFLSCQLPFRYVHLLSWVRPPPFSWDRLFSPGDLLPFASFAVVFLSFSVFQRVTLGEASPFVLLFSHQFHR